VTLISVPTRPKVKNFSHEEYGKLEIFNGPRIEEIAILESHLTYFDNWESEVLSLDDILPCRASDYLLNSSRKI
jgi:hypothetical protein